MGALVVLWLLCGVVCAVIASSKGKSTVGWFFLGCILGIFGIILVAVLPSENPTTVRIVDDWSNRSSEPRWMARSEAPSRAISQPTQTSPPQPSLGYDTKKWQVLKEVDSEVAASAARVAEFGARYEHELAEKYFVLGDRSYLAAIEQKITEKAQSEKEEKRKLAEANGSALATSADEEARDYSNLMRVHDGRDPEFDIKVASVEPYFGSWIGFQGGIKVTLENGDVILRRRGVRRVFKYPSEVT